MRSLSGSRAGSGIFLRTIPSIALAVLYRANFISRNFEDVLTAESIPYAVVGSVAFFGRMEVKDMLAYLKAVFNPEDDVALLRIINTPPRGIGGTTVEMLTQNALQRGVPISQILSEKARDPQQPSRAARSLLHFQEMLESWMTRRDKNSLAGLLESIFREIGYKEMLEKQETAQEALNRIANIEELIRAADRIGEPGRNGFRVSGSGIAFVGAGPPGSQGARVFDDSPQCQRARV